jgi:hypothetical protein
VAEARAALGAPGEIIHTVTIIDRRSPLIAEDGRRRIGTISDRVERWVQLSPFRERLRMTVTRDDGGGLESIERDYADGVARIAQSWNDELQVSRLAPDYRDAYERLNTEEGLITSGPDPLAAVRAMLADGRLKPAGETDFAGRRVLRLTGSAPGAGPRGAARLDTEYLVDATTHEPVQVSIASSDGAPMSRITYETYERLPATEANLALLRIPGAAARRVVR